ncbi:MAG: transporter substrate-binding domain-containing protein [Spirochaetes bacterium]|nr:transporter substrate-binding domain-containing protein [Spirochaetota bacterium]
MLGRILLPIALLLGLLSARPYFDILESGELRVGIRVRTGVLGADLKSGFHYDLAKAFALEHGRLAVKLVVKTAIKDYFAPGIWDEVDVVADNLTQTAERLEKVDFVTVMPTSYVLVVPKGRTAREAKATLSAQKIIVCQDTSYFNEIRANESDRIWGKKYQYFFSATANDQVADLLAGKGTVTILDANLALPFINEIDQLENASIGTVQKIGWAVPKGQTSLAARLGPFFSTIKRSGAFQELWSKASPRLSYLEYLKLLDARDDDFDIPHRGEIDKLIRERLATPP